MKQIDLAKKRLDGTTEPPSKDEILREFASSMRDLQEDAIDADLDEIQDVNENNRLIYKQVYGGDWKDLIVEINGKDVIIRPGDDGYNEAYIQTQEYVRKNLPLN